ncbi:MAG TPA: iron-containing alcohol dehydrogenase [Clostridiales bacterium]|jgi:alcohol dehydrogenase class IV|nr:iron-containing alcohol dehydrogenase [Clostridiales bacterium]HOJ35249.1 iron-containing alcohol dehydrogenase [Clostridiales bacterium]HOL78656.1 iron-containing alcohol dehydrogenase [Clostridiales bacterium]HPU67469.1 iron-containing alcohol dehydrogenase [Clostridiales bacterium]HQA06145.1 iron-containing alcohol dehydrogenase [Clostridiales bacterium]
MNPIYKAYCRAYQTVFRGAAYLIPWREPELITGAGTVKTLPSIIKAKGINNVLIVTDKGITKLGLYNSLVENLEKTGIKYSIYDGTQPNPTINNVNEAKAMYINNRCEAIIAFGGGSPMDCAKLCGAAVVRPKKPIQKMRGLFKVMRKLPPLFAIPTTAGTGSETTIVAVVTDSETHEKYPVNDPQLRPRYAVLDPELTVSLPPSITAATGMDVLTHAVEAYIGRSNTKSTKEAAEKAAKLVFENLYEVYSNGQNLEARENMLVASYFAGIAFTRAYVGYVHAIAHNIGGLYNVPHGLANAIIMPYVLEAYGKYAYKSLAKLADLTGAAGDAATEEEKAKNFIEAIKEMNRKMEIPDKIAELKEEDIDTIAKRALKEANPLYPVPKLMDRKEIAEVIRRLLP